MKIIVPIHIFCYTFKKICDYLNKLLGILINEQLIVGQSTYSKVLWVVETHQYLVVQT